MAIGLTNDKSDTGHSLTQVGLFPGLGFSAPIANRSTATQASINLHAWFEEDISHSAGDSQASRTAIIFGPSISIGNIAASALLSYFLEELGPIVYNKAVADVQERLQARIKELDIEVHEEEFQYWRKFDIQRKNK